MEEKALDDLAQLSQEMEAYRLANEARIDAWWDSLPLEQRCDAFYAVVKRLVDGELKDKGTYRYVLYNVFGFGPDMYVSGMDCGFMALHKRITTDEEDAMLYQLEQLKSEAPPEAETEAEKTAYAFGWFKAMEKVRNDRT